MATIKTFNITAVKLDKVEFTYSPEYNVYTKTDGSKFNRTKEKRTEEISWKFSTIGGESKESPCSYTRGGSGNDTYSLTAVLKTEYIITEHGWKHNRNDDYETESKFDDLKNQVFAEKKYEYTQLGPTEDGTAYKYKVKVSIWGVTKEIEGNDTASKTINFYPHPAKFTFNNCIPGEPWKIEDGINSLITNITKFQGQAQQRKNWKYQSSQAKCPSFFNDDNIMTRNQMNAVYRYVKETGSNVEEFKKEDKKGNRIYHPISAKMFNDLADIINENT